MVRTWLALTDFYWLILLTSWYNSKVIIPESLWCVCFNGRVNAIWQNQKLSRQETPNSVAGWGDNVYMIMLLLLMMMVMMVMVMMMMMTMSGTMMLRMMMLRMMRMMWMMMMMMRMMWMIEGSLEVKLPTIWTDEKQSREEAERRERLEERRVEEKE